MKIVTFQSAAYIYEVDERLESISIRIYMDKIKFVMCESAKVVV